MSLQRAITAWAKMGGYGIFKKKRERRGEQERTTCRVREEEEEGPCVCVKKALGTFLLLLLFGAQQVM